MVIERLGKSDWLQAARLALLKGGPGNLRVERLARDMGVTKGSFYWHFDDASALMEALLVEWEAEAELLIAALRDPGSGGAQGFVEKLEARVVLSERGDVPSDAAIFGWAAVEPKVQDRVRVAEAKRISLISEMAGSRERGEIVYMAYLGFILRRRSADDAASLFAILARFMTDELAGNAAKHPEMILDEGVSIR